jgi:transposase
VRSYIRAESFPERQARVLRQPGLLEPHIPYLIERWNASCRTETILWNEIKERGYTGKHVTVFSLVTRLRKALGIPAKNRSVKTGKVALPEKRPLTPRQAVWLILKRPEQRDEPTKDQIGQLRQAHPDFDTAITLTEAFADLVRTRNFALLDGWLDRAARSSLRSFQAFATSLRGDYAAVRAGVELVYSTGPVEGAINRLKMVKRTMFGRAGFALLQRRVLLSG